MRHVGAIVGLLATAVILAACGSTGKGPVTVNWYVFPEPSGSFAIDIPHNTTWEIKS